jgi:hypothetical protein
MTAVLSLIDLTMVLSEPAIGVVFVRQGGKEPGELETTIRRRECTCSF